MSKTSTNTGEIIVQLSPAPMFFPTTGAQLRNHHLARQLARIRPVYSLTFAADAPVRAPHKDAGMEHQAIPRPTGHKVRALLGGAFGAKPYSILHYTTQPMRDALESVLRTRKVAAVQIEAIQLCGYASFIRQVSPLTAIVLDWHNVESKLVARFAETTANPAKRLYARRTADQLRRLEKSMLQLCDLHLVVSNRERDELAALNPQAAIRVIDNGVDAEQFEGADGEIGSRPDIIFVGSMDYYANEDAVRYFVAEIWPKIRSVFPQAVFRIVGRKPGAAVQALAATPGVVVTGTVDDVRPYYQRARAVVVPLRVGGGTRLKILEAFAAGTPVVSTGLGAEGLTASEGHDYLRAESPDEFVECVRRLYEDDSQWRKLSSAGRELAVSRYAWPAIGRDLQEAYRETLGIVPLSEAAIDNASCTRT
ncbi:MAG TPA: glycosyltransferase family 4 protein [Bryobacteraceae bacterium]|nr:glycosyltransferase family 4 protein [Bryobacteraceae bacterium]